MYSIESRPASSGFLTETEQVVPWGVLAAILEPFYLKPEGVGRPPIEFGWTLRIHCLQQWVTLSDPAVEKAVRFARHAAVSQHRSGPRTRDDETTIFKFRHLPGAQQLGAQLFTLIRAYLDEQGVTVSRGTIVDATIIHAPVRRRITRRRGIRRCIRRRRQPVVRRHAGAYQDR